MDSSTEEPEGWYPRIGGLATGSGLALGGGYRTHLLGRSFYGDLSAIVSTKRYVGLDAKLRLPSPRPQRLEFWTRATFRRLTQEDYFGAGLRSSQSTHSNYGLTSVDVAGEATVHVAPWLRVGTSGGYFMPRVKHGTDTEYASIESMFTDATAPGLVTQPDFLHYGAFVIADYRDTPGNPHRGGWYRATAARWEDRTHHQFSFGRFDAELDQFIEIRGPSHVVALRGGISYLNNDPGMRVPFYVYPYIGGASTIRSFPEFRFRDENATFVSAEYRQEIGPYVQVVPFVDAGKVAANWEQINPHQLKTGYGIGVRAGTRSRTFITLDVGFGGGEGVHAFVKFLP
jgi:outer membrane protein assembly factor BamA